MNKFRFIKILNKGATSVLEQGLFSGISFIVSILLARWLLQEDYGAFSIAMSIFLLLAGLYSSIVLEPLSIFGPQTSGDQKKEYFGSVLVFHSAISIILSIGAICYSFFWKMEGASVIRVMAISLPFTLSYWLIRWKFYNDSETKKVLFFTFVYSSIILSLLFFFKTSNSISSNVVFVFTGLTSLTISLLTIIKIPIKFDKEAFLKHIYFHWDYGKWILLASLLQWVSMQIYLIFIATKLSLADSGGYRAIQNLATPLEQVSTAIGLLMIPWVSKKYATNKKFLSNIHWIDGVLGLFGIIYLLAIYFTKEDIVRFLYNEKYSEYTWLIPYLIGIPIILSFSRGSQIGTRIIQKPYLLLIAYGISSGFTLLAGPILIDTYGILGAALGRLFATIIFSLVLNILYFRTARVINDGINFVEFK